jgi:hypothetical protein
VSTGDSTIAIGREELCGHVVSPATREHTIIEETFFCAVRAGAI